MHKFANHAFLWPQPVYILYIYTAGSTIVRYIKYDPTWDPTGIVNKKLIYIYIIYKPKKNTPYFRSLAYPDMGERSERRTRQQTFFVFFYITNKCIMIHIKLYSFWFWKKKKAEKKINFFDGVSTRKVLERWNDFLEYKWPVGCTTPLGWLGLGSGVLLRSCFLWLWRYFAKI